MQVANTSSRFRESGGSARFARCVLTDLANVVPPRGRSMHASRLSMLKPRSGWRRWICREVAPRSSARVDATDRQPGLEPRRAVPPCDLPKAFRGCGQTPCRGARLQREFSCRCV